jgi:hypothetical protein
MSFERSMEKIGLEMRAGRPPYLNIFDNCPKCGQPLTKKHKQKEHKKEKHGT